ncbi:MAG: AraC family transcriptional regulator [Pseudomonadota bacterium]|jgi:AraC-like DNA-binding protein
MGIEWRTAHPALHPFVIGFVERVDVAATGASIELPFAIPVIHIALNEAPGPCVAISTGTRRARAVPQRSALHTFVVALGFSGVALFGLKPALATIGHFIDIDDAFWCSLRGRLCQASDFVERAAIVERMLLAQIEARSGALPALFKAADAIAHDRWSGPIHDLARHCGIEERTLRNRFRHDLGWSPKQLLRVARFNRALRALHPQPWSGPPVQDVRLEFFDDSHFYREFRAHAGISPAAFIAAKRHSGDAMLHHLSLDSLRQVR